MREQLGLLVRTAAVLPALLALAAGLGAQDQVGSIRGVVFDADFNVPLREVQVVVAELEQEARTSPQGDYVFPSVPPGSYTLVFTKPGYVRQVRPDVVVSAGDLARLDVQMPGDFMDMDDYVARDILALGGGSEAALLNLRFDSPSLLDSIGSDLMSRAGASDAASALRLIPGATVQDGKFAVIRGLPDRYVSSQMNGVRLPSADEDRRAVELDQFPASVIESVQVTKTFTPDQQGDASGGAVNVKLKGIPDETILQFRGTTGFNTNVNTRSDFLSYVGGGLDTWGMESGQYDPQATGLSWGGAVGTSRTDAPRDFKWSGALGGKKDLDRDTRIGAFGSFFYERDSSFFDDGRDDSLWVDNPGQAMSPEFTQGAPSQGQFKTSLFDITQGRRSVQWGGLGILGIETDDHALSVTYLHTRSAEDAATLAVDTRGKEFYFPGYDPTNPTGPGSDPDEELEAAPYLRTQTLAYSERTTSTLQFHGDHRLPGGGFTLGSLRFDRPEVAWRASTSSADFYEPDKRQFGSVWLGPSVDGPPSYQPFLPAENVNLGNIQRTYKEIVEDDIQVALDVTLPFEKGEDESGSLRLGMFDDNVKRTFDQDSFTNPNDQQPGPTLPFTTFWSSVFPFEVHAIQAAETDVDYNGDLDITAYYGMAEIPLGPNASLTGGVRLESTKLSVVNTAEEDANWFPPGATAGVDLEPGEADVRFEQDDVLPSLGLSVEVTEDLTVRAAYSQTVARQTFKEITPILQTEFLGGPIFIGNPTLEMSSLRNYDLRFDYTPYEGGLFSLSLFHKRIGKPIEYIQKLIGFNFTTAENYPRGEMSGFEVELRQDLERLAQRLEGVSMGLNATFIDSEVILPNDEAAQFLLPGIQAPLDRRDMTQAPEHLYNLFLTWDIEDTGTQASLFYTVKGDTLVAGAAVSQGNLIPSIYETEFGTLNASLSQRLGDNLTLRLAAKNLLNPEIQSVYRSEYLPAGDVLQSSFTRGIELSFGLSLDL